MNNRITTILVVSLLIGIGVISFIPQGVKSDLIPEEMWTVDFTQDPKPGFYKDDITFTGTAGCSDPVYWNWTFQPGSVNKSGNPVTYSWAPVWENKSYGVSLKVTNESGASASVAAFAPVTIEYDIYGCARALPLIVDFSDDVTIYVDVYNERGAHICPEGYQVTVEIVKGSELYESHVAWPGNITGPNDLGPDGEELGLTTTWYNAHPSDWYRAKVSLDTRFDEDTSDNGPFYSNWFYVLPY